MTSLKTLALESLHKEWGARFSPFAGYSMPVQYADGIRAEHLHTRTACGLFDVSHMGQLRVTGSNLFTSLELALPIDFDDWPIGRQRYTVLTNHSGGIDDDLMVARAAEDEVRMVVNAANRDTDLSTFHVRCPELIFEWVDAALIALQGAAAEDVVAALDPSARNWSFMQCGWLTLLGTRCFATRSGYTGEDGFEISIPQGVAEKIVRELAIHTAVKPVGLGARDTLRLEAGLPLCGQDIGPSVSPIEAGLVFAIAKSRRPTGGKAGGFPGDKLIEDQLLNGPPRKLIAYKSASPVPIRHGASLKTIEGSSAGEVTSGTMSPSLETPILLGLVRSEYANQPLVATVRQHTLPVEPVPLPFVPKRFKRK